MPLFIVFFQAQVAVTYLTCGGDQSHVTDMVWKQEDAGFPNRDITLKVALFVGKIHIWIGAH
jgi:hypothetical protein